MKRRYLITILFCWTLLPITVAQSRATSTLEIAFTGIRNEKGLIAIGINSSPDGWPRKPQMELNWKKARISEGVFTVKIESLAYGTYAISVLDDENSNLEMEMFMGIPKEGYGFSMNPPFKLSAPSFEECSFRVDKPFQQITIHLRYTGKGR